LKKVEEIKKEKEKELSTLSSQLSSLEQQLQAVGDYSDIKHELEVIKVSNYHIYIYIYLYLYG
jgi:hypothetical protein